MKWRIRHMRQPFLEQISLEVFGAVTRCYEPPLPMHYEQEIAQIPLR